MSRTIPSRMITSLSQATIYPFYAIECFFDAGTLRLWTGIGNKTFNGNLYYGASDLLALDAVEEKNDMSAASMSISLSGQNSATVATALAEPFQNRKCFVHFGAWTSSAFTAYDMIQIFSGLMDRMPISDSGDTAIIKVVAENILNELDRPIPRRYTQESQASRYPADTFFSFVADLIDKDIVWGPQS